MIKIKKSTNNNNSGGTNLNNNQSNFGVWDTIDLLTKHQATNSGRNVYDNIQDWLYKVTHKLNQHQIDERDSGVFDKDTNTNSSRDELILGTLRLDSETTCNSTPRAPNDKIMNVPLQGKTKTKKVKNPDVKLPVNGPKATGAKMGGPSDVKTKKNTKKNVKLPKINKNKKVKDEPIAADDEFYKDGYFGSLVDCNFNLPRVSAQLEKLMGTNIVRLTDRNYMQQLRARIQEEYHVTLQKRISQREQTEDERQKELILNGSYSVHNCPPRLIIVHSVALAREMERERNLIMSGKGETCPHDLADHPVFIINQQTNEQIAKARSKLKTTREKNAERLIRQGAKWEKEREIYDEMDRMKEIQRKEKREAELLMEQEYANANRVRGIDLLRVKNRDYAENEMALKTFVDSEREKMLCRTGTEAKRLKQKQLDARRAAELAKQRKPKRKHHHHHHGEYDGEGEFELESEFDEEGELEYLESDEEEHESQEKKDGIVQIHPPSGGMRPDADAASAFGTTAGSVSTSQFANEYEIESYAPSITTVEIEEHLTNEEQAEIAKHHIVDEEEYLKYHYEDPKILKLKQTDNVQELYELADEIIGGTASTAPKKIEKHEN